MFRAKLFFITLFLSFVSLPSLASPLKPDAKSVNKSEVTLSLEAVDGARNKQAYDVEAPDAEDYSVEIAEDVEATDPEEALLREQIQALEERQQLLEQEIDLLRQQVEAQIEQNERNAQENTSAPVAEDSTPEDPEAIETADAEQYPMGLNIYSSIGTFDPRLSVPQDFAVVDPGIAQTIGGDLAILEYEPNEALRYGATLRFEGTPIDVGFSSVTVTSSGAANAVAPTDGFLFATFSTPGQNEEAQTSSATSDIRYSMTDIEAGYRFDINDSIASRIYGGIRFADISQNTNVAYDGIDFVNTNIDIARSFSGTGLRVGNHTNLNLGSGFSLFGQAGGALLVGDVRSQQQEVDNNGLDVIATLNQSSTRVVPMIDLSAGVNWQKYMSETALLDISFGYAIEEWFNVLDITRYTDSSGSGIITQDSSNLSSSGLFFELGFTFDF